MKQFMNSLFIAAMILFNSLTYAKTGLLFKITESGAAASGEVILCLNGKGPLSCQNYHVSARSLAISTTANHRYPVAGIKVLTPGYKATGCAPYPNGYCLFAVNSQTPTTILLNGGSPSTYTVGGSVSGYSTNGLVVQNNGANDIAISTNGVFTFTQPLAAGAAYHVTVSSQPAGQTCSVAHGTGTIGNANVSNVSVTCSAITYTITASSTGNGSISPGGSVTVNSGGSQTFTATPNAGYGVNQWLVDGSLAQTGGMTYSLNNITANHMVSVSFGSATITPSVSTLALAVSDVNPGASRKITITNNSLVPATNVQVVPNDFPANTTFDASGCDTIQGSGGSCEIIVTPGAAASNNCTTGTIPAGSLNITADGGISETVNVYVIGYGCQYQGGYVFAIDDTTDDTGSIGGKVVSLEDQAPRSYNGVIWSSNGTGGASSDVIYDSIWGIALGSTDSSPLPNATTPASYPATLVTGQSNCNGSYDGVCNSNNILVYYSEPNKTPAISLSYYAAGRCKDYTGGGFSDWYLPAICEMGPASNGSVCAANTLNIVSNLPGLLSTLSAPDSGCAFGGNCLYGTYWSSTEQSGNPRNLVWTQYFASGSYQSNYSKEGRLGVRCARGLTY